MTAIQQQEQADIKALTPEEAKEVRKFLDSAYPWVDNWTVGEIATQARYWREAKQHRGDKQ